MDIVYSLIIPVYNRPEEVDELLCSLQAQTYKAFEVILVEDGSTRTCRAVAGTYASGLAIRYFYKPNSGPGLSRNYGAGKSRGSYLIFLDSDCIVPPSYLERVSEAWREPGADMFGGPDHAADSFSRIQKAINYSMTSFFTTGGIRGGHKRLDRFYPRSFNLGVRKEVFEAVGGFSDMRFGEDIDFSIRVIRKGFGSRLFPCAWVYHKRRTDFRKFFKQVYNSGMARVNLYRKYPDSLRAVHLLPVVFTIGLFLATAGFYFFPWLSLPFLSYAFLVGSDAALKNKCFSIGLLSVCATFIQLIAYGSGFLSACWRMLVLKRNSFFAFRENFYE